MDKEIIDKSAKQASELSLKINNNGVKLCEKAIRKTKRNMVEVCCVPFISVIETGALYALDKTSSSNLGFFVASSAFITVFSSAAATAAYKALKQKLSSDKEELQDAIKSRQKSLQKHYVNINKR